MIKHLLESSIVNKFDDITRFNGTKTVQAKENLAQHSFWVTFYANYILENYFKVDHHWYYEFKSVVLQRAMLHDFDETITGDIIYPTKHNTASGSLVRSAIEDYVNKVCMTKKDIDKSVEMYANEYLSINPNITEDIENLADAIIKLCDWYSCYKFCKVECDLGNTAICPMIETCKEQISCVAVRVFKATKKVLFTHPHLQINTDNFKFTI